MDHFITKNPPNEYQIDFIACEEQAQVTDRIAQRLVAIEHEIFTHPLRKAMFKIKGWVPRTIMTPSGVVTFKRRLYLDKRTETPHFLLDLVCHIEKYQRLTAAAICRIAEYAVTCRSYAHAGQIALVNTPVSRQTVLNCIDRVHFNAASDTYRPPADVLHISVDGFYANYAKQNHKREIKFASIAPGIEHLTPHRNHLLNKVLVTPCHPNQSLSTAIQNAIKTHYQVHPHTKVFILGDGAPWIRELVNSFANAHFVIDPFHYIRAINSLPNSQVIYDFVKAFNYKALRSLRRQCQDDRQRLTLSYILRHLESTKHWTDPDFIGCHAEHIVSHYFHHRLRSKPRNWGVRLFQVASLIASSVHSRMTIQYEENRSFPSSLDELFHPSLLLSPRFIYDYNAPILSGKVTLKSTQIHNLLYGY